MRLRAVAHATVLLALTGMLRNVDAQETKPLPVQATVAWTVTDVSSAAPDDGSSVSFSWTGRLALRILDPLYVGFTAEGMGRDAGFSLPGFDDVYLTSSASTMTWLGYLQYYPLHQRIGFLRGGAGWSYAYTSVPAGAYIASTRDIRFAWTAGAGADIRTYRPVHFTPAIDYTALVDVPEGPALDHGLVFSIGVTLK